MEAGLTSLRVPRDDGHMEWISRAVLLGVGLALTLGSGALVVYAVTSLDTLLAVVIAGLSAPFLLLGVFLLLCGAVLPRLKGVSFSRKGGTLDIAALVLDVAKRMRL